jgi:hypothetical protein
MELYLGIVIAGTLIAAVTAALVQRHQRRLQDELFRAYYRWYDDHVAGRLK